MSIVVIPITDNTIRKLEVLAATFLPVVQDTTRSEKSPGLEGIVEARAVTVGIVEAKVATYSHPAALHWASGSDEGSQYRGDLPSGTRLQSWPLQLEEVVWWLQVD